MNRSVAFWLAHLSSINVKKHTQLNDKRHSKDRIHKSRDKDHSVIENTKYNYFQGLK